MEILTDEGNNIVKLNISTLETLHIIKKKCYENSVVFLKVCVIY